jgi:mannosyltransferase
VVAAIALALNAGVVAASQQVRPFTLAILAILVSTLALVLALERSPVWWLAYVPACALLSLTHPLAATVVAAHAVAAVLALRERRSSPAAAIAGLALGATAAAPLTLAFVADRADDGGGGLDPGDVLTGIGRAGGWNVALLVLAAGGLAVLLTRRLAAPSWKAALVTGLVAAPILATIVSAAFVPVFPERALVVCAPGLALACAAAVAWMPDRDAALGAAAILVVFAVPGLVAWYTQPAAEDWRSAVRAVSREAAPDETVVVLPERSRAALAYYAPEVALSSRARGRGAWVLIRSRDDRQAIRTARRIVRTPAYALLAQTRFGERLVLQHWVRP